MPKLSKRILADLKRYESRNILFQDPDGEWPIVWHRAKGMKVWDVDGKSYLDMTAAFGVCAAGHGHPALTQAASRQMRTLVHAMGDVHPHAGKAALAKALSSLTFKRWSAKSKQANSHGKTIFCNSGFEAVEAALKTAILATGKPGVIAFKGSYHGLGYGALNTTHRDHFKTPFKAQLKRYTDFVDYPTTPAILGQLEHTLRHTVAAGKHGAVLVEPIQGRGGIRVPSPGFLSLLREFCTKNGLILILDEVFTGFCRTGRWFACEHEGVVPDIICLGKALTGGFPLSACVGRADLMDRAWPPSNGEAIHTSTFLGHPIGCAMALRQIRLLDELKLSQAAERKGKLFTEALEHLLVPEGYRMHVRGKGLMIGLELLDDQGAPASSLCIETVKSMLGCGYILLPEGEYGNIISFTPPLIVTEAQIFRTVKRLAECLRLNARKLNAGGCSR